MARNKTSAKSSTVVLDLGGYAAKLGHAADDAPKLLHNCIYKAKSERKRQFISDQIRDCADQHQLYHQNPYSSGYMVNWELQERLLDYFFGEEVLNIDTKHSHLLVTEPYFNFSLLKKYFAEAIFEDYAFSSAFICPPAYLTAHLYRQSHPDESSCFVIDSGHSSTHLVPLIDGNISWDDVIRAPVGGKLLTNQLKQRITFQQFDVMDETHVMNQLKEQMCFVSTDLASDFQRCTAGREELTRTFVLPDYSSIFKGFVRPAEETFRKPIENEQLIRLSADRFVTTEIMFRPSIVNDPRMGISEACVSSIQRFPEEKQHHLFRNITLSGGSVLFDGFVERLGKDLQTALPEFGEVEIATLKNPQLNPWYGGKSFVEKGLFEKFKVTKTEYDEHGENICEKRFIRNTSKR